MEIRPTSRIEPIHLSNKDASYKNNGFPSKKLKIILLNLRKVILDLSSWIKNTSFSEKDKIDEKFLLNFLNKIDSFYANINDLEEYTDHPESQDDLRFALEVLSEIDNMLKGRVKKLTLCSYWKYDDFSFQMAMERALITPLIDIKRMIIHLFDEVPERNWELVILVLDEMAGKLLV